MGVSLQYGDVNEDPSVVCNFAAISILPFCIHNEISRLYDMYGLMQIVKLCYDVEIYLQSFDAYSEPVSQLLLTFQFCISICSC
jgi:hypothetical protein